MGVIGKSQLGTGSSSALTELDRIKQRSDNDQEWQLVKYGKKYYVLDGNHRAAALKLTGAKKIKANVWNAGGK